MSTADLIVTGIMWVAVAPVNLYPLFYAFRPWRSTPQGTALMMLAVGTAIVIDVVFATLAFGKDYPFRDVVRIFGFGLFAVGTWCLFVGLLMSPGARNYPPRSWVPARVRNDEEVRDGR